MPGFLRYLISTLVAIGFVPCAAHAQGVAQTTTAHRAWEVTFVAGALAGHAEVPQDVRFLDAWSHSGLAGVVVGRHWSSHLKTEVELTASGEGRQYFQRSLTLPDYPNPVWSGGEQFTKVREVAASVTWQFLDNEWVHPFVQVGVAVDVVEQRRYIFPTTVYSGDPRTPGTSVIFVGERQEGPVRTATARGVVGGGAKLYVSPRLFFRTDARAAFGRRIEHLSLRAGMGVDF